MVSEQASRDPWAGFSVVKGGSDHGYHEDVERPQDMGQQAGDNPNPHGGCPAQSWGVGPSPTILAPQWLEKHQSETRPGNRKCELEARGRHQESIPTSLSNS